MLHTFTMYSCPRRHFRALRMVSSGRRYPHPYPRPSPRRKLLLGYSNGKSSNQKETRCGSPVQIRALILDQILTMVIVFYWEYYSNVSD